MTPSTLSMMSAFAYVGARSKWFTQRLAIASGLLSLAFGLFLTYQIFFVKGLLTNHPQWTPHLDLLDCVRASPFFPPHFSGAFPVVLRARAQELFASNPRNHF